MSLQRAVRNAGLMTLVLVMLTVGAALACLGLLSSCGWR